MTVPKRTVPKRTVPSAGRPTVAVVTIAGGRREHLRRQARSISGQSVAPDEYVIIDLGGSDPHDVLPEGLDATVVSQPADPGALPLARARNTAFGVADADVTVFLDVDCIAHPELVGRYVELMTGHPGVHAGPVGYLPRDAGDSIDPLDLDPLATYQPGRPTPATALHATGRVELFWSLSFAVDRSSWDRIGGFDERYVGYGGEDTDFGRRAMRAAVQIWFSSGPRAYHQYHAVSSPPVEHVAAICRNATTFHRTWGTWPMEGWLAAFAEDGLIEWTPLGDRCDLVGASAVAPTGRGI